MITNHFSLKNILIALMLGVVVLFGGVATTHAQIFDANGNVTGSPEDAVYPPENAFQNTGCSIFNFSFVECFAGPIARWSSSAMLSVGGSFLKLSGSIFDFAINRVIINFSETLSQPSADYNIMTAINGGWTFFRDVANIIMIGMFVFIAVSLILGLKEYGQKKLIARVLIIAVLMNFSLLFTKIIIDSSNFLAYAIYAQTAGAGGTGGGTQVFSIADKVLAPLHITGTWDTSALAAKIYNEPDGGGALKAFSFGILGFLILSFLAAVILYGAFLIIARAILFVVLMLSAPLAYVTYLAPHFEASQFGWSNWWRSLINNAAFAPLLMIFLSISILIFQTASPSLRPEDTIGALLTDPARQVLADGWRVLFVYFLGTGLLFVSFRLSSSLAGSISGVRLGQAATMLPFAWSAAAGGKFLQRTAGVKLGNWADSKGAQLKQARMTALQSGKAEDWANVEKLRKQKALLDKSAKSSFNMMNTQLGKAIAANSGLKGKFAGETKGGLADDMHARAIAAEERAKQAQVTASDKAAIRDEAHKAELKKHEDDLKTAKTNLDTANAALEKARVENSAANDKTLKDQAEKQVTQNKIERAPEMQKAQAQVEVIKKERETKVASNDAEIQKMAQAAEKMSGQEKERQIQKIETTKAAHAQAIQEIDERISSAHEKISSIEVEIKAPADALLERQKRAATNMRERETEYKKADTTYKQLNATIDKNVKEQTKTAVKTAEDNSKAQLHNVAADVSNRAGIGIGKYRVLGGGSSGAHMVEHHYEKYTKKESANDLLKDLKGAIEKTKGGGDAAH